MKLSNEEAKFWKNYSGVYMSTILKEQFPEKRDEYTSMRRWAAYYILKQFGYTNFDLRDTLHLTYAGQKRRRLGKFEKEREDWFYYHIGRIYQKRKEFVEKNKITPNIYGI